VKNLPGAAFVYMAALVLLASPFKKDLISY